MKIKIFFKKLLQLGLLVLIGFIIYSNLRIKGVWIQVKNINSDYNISNNEILVFNNFNFDKICELYSCDDLNSEFLFAFGDYLYFDQKIELDIPWKKIKFIDKDLLVIEQFNARSLYKKLPDSLKQEKLNLKKYLDNFFTINNGKFIDTIYLSNKILLSKTNLHPYKKWINHYFEVKNINGYKLMYLNSSINPFIIQEKNNKTIFHQLSSNNINVINLELLSVSKDLKNGVEKIIQKIEEDKY